MNLEFNYLNKINKRIASIIQFGGTVSNPLLTPYTQALRELNIKYRWDKQDQTIKMSLGKDNQAKADALERKLAEKHATTYQEYRKNFKERIEKQKGRPLTDDELDHELKAQKALWNLTDNFQVFYNFTRTGEDLPPELAPYEYIIDEFRGSENNRALRDDPERMKDLALELEKAVNDYRDNERGRGMRDIWRGTAL